ncbi:MAG: hypothetical protein M3151_05945 [Actinomycetota bacterium]|nr:hypothetical protein [Actinomycetota bacterium]
MPDRRFRVGASDSANWETTKSSEAAPRTPPQQEKDAGEFLVGAAGDDVIRGGEGEDEVRGGEGKDRLYGGPGDDAIDAQDPGSVWRAGSFEILCGPGPDEAIVDAGDAEKPRGCEMFGVGKS